MAIILSVAACSSRNESIQDISLRASRDAHQVVNDKGGRGAISEIIKCYKKEASRNEFLYCFALDSQVKQIDSIVAEEVQRDSSDFFKNDAFFQRFSKVEKYYSQDKNVKYTENDELKQVFYQIEIWLAHGLQIESARIRGENTKLNTSEPEYLIAEMYFDGEKVNKDTKKAYEWFLKSANNGDASAQVLIGMMYVNGEGVEKDLTEGAKWYKKSALQGNREAQAFLALAYINGDGVPIDNVQAEKWLRLSADQGFTYAQRDLGYMLINKKTQGSYVEAVKYFRMAAEQEEPESQLMLGLAYKSGKGVSKDETNAVKWLEKAYKNGVSDAKAELDLINSN